MISQIVSCFLACYGIISYQQIFSRADYSNYQGNSYGSTQDQFGFDYKYCSFYGSILKIYQCYYVTYAEQNRIEFSNNDQIIIVIDMTAKNIGKSLSYFNILRQLKAFKDQAEAQQLNQKFQIGQEKLAISSMEQTEQNLQMNRNAYTEEMSAYYNSDQYHKDDRTFQQLSPNLKGISSQNFYRQKYIYQYLVNQSQVKSVKNGQNQPSLLKKQIQQRFQRKENSILLNKTKMYQQNSKLHKTNLSRQKTVKTLKQIKYRKQQKIGSIIFNLDKAGQATFSPLKLKQQLNNQCKKVSQDYQCKTVRIQKQDNQYNFGDSKRNINMRQFKKLDQIELSETKRVRNNKNHLEIDRQSEIYKSILFSQNSSSRIIPLSLNKHNKCVRSKQKTLLKQLPFHQRQKQLLRGRQEKYTKLRQNKQQIQLKQCSFKPKLTLYRC